MVPVGLPAINMGFELLLEGPIGSLSLAICLRVIGSGETEGGAKGSKNSFPEPGSESGVSIRDEGLRDAMVSDNSIYEELGEVRG